MLPGSYDVIASDGGSVLLWQRERAVIIHVRYRLVGGRFLPPPSWVEGLTASPPSYSP